METKLTTTQARKTTGQIKNINLEKIREIQDINNLWFGQLCLHPRPPIGRKPFQCYHHPNGYKLTINIAQWRYFDYKESQHRERSHNNILWHSSHLYNELLTSFNQHYCSLYIHLHKHFTHLCDLSQHSHIHNRYTCALFTKI